MTCGHENPNVPTIPFLKPQLPTADRYLHYLRQIDASHRYSNFGPLNEAFERRLLREWFDGEGAATTVSNATIGLMLAISRVRRRHARWALMPSFTFAATPLAAQWCGLEPYFLDVTPGNWSLDTDAVADAVRRLGDEIAVIVPYATFATVIDLQPYAQMAARGLPVVLDAAASFGTEVHGRQFACGFEPPVVFSFHATKSFGIGEGGLVYSSNAELIEEIRAASNFGFGTTRVSSMLGLNGKMSEYSAARGLALLEEFRTRVDTRKRLLTLYSEAVQEAGFTSAGWRLQEMSGAVAIQFFPLLAPLGVDNAGVVRRLAARGIEVRTYFSPPCHLQPQFSAAPHGPLPVTERLGQGILSLPCWEGMTAADVSLVVASLAEATSSERARTAATY